MTIEDFIAKEIELWGFDYIESLFNQGYTIVISDRGFKWLLPVMPVSHLTPA